MQHPFVEFLIARDLVPKNVGDLLSGTCRVVREPIGMVAVGHGVLSADQIDGILDRQRESQKLFGEIAVELGFLTPEQVETLVKIQEFRVGAQISEALALAGVLSCEESIQYLGAYLVRDRELIEMMVDE